MISLVISNYAYANPASNNVVLVSDKPGVRKRSVFPSIILYLIVRDQKRLPTQEKSRRGTDNNENLTRTYPQRYSLVRVCAKVFINPGRVLISRCCSISCRSELPRRLSRVTCRIPSQASLFIFGKEFLSASICLLVADAVLLTAAIHNSVNDKKETKGAQAPAPTNEEQK